MQEILLGLLQAVTKILPLSPFQEWIAQLASLPYLSWLNWFFPVGGCIKVVVAWVGVISLFYGYSVVLRWVKVIDG